MPVNAPQVSSYDLLVIIGQKEVELHLLRAEIEQLRAQLATNGAAPETAARDPILGDVLDA